MTAPASEEKYLTLAEVGKRWRMSARTVGDMAAQGRIASLRPGRRVLIPVKAVVAFEKANTQHGGEHRPIAS